MYSGNVWYKDRFRKIAESCEQSFNVSRSFQQTLGKRSKVAQKHFRLTISIKIRFCQQEINILKLAQRNDQKQWMTTSEAVVQRQKLSKKPRKDLRWRLLQKQFSRYLQFQGFPSQILARFQLRHCENFRKFPRKHSSLRTFILFGKRRLPHYQHLYGCSLQRKIKIYEHQQIFGLQNKNQSNGHVGIFANNYHQSWNILGAEFRFPRSRHDTKNLNLWEKPFSHVLAVFDETITVTIKTSKEICCLLNIILSTYWLL